MISTVNKPPVDGGKNPNQEGLLGETIRYGEEARIFQEAFDKVIIYFNLQ